MAKKRLITAQDKEDARIAFLAGTTVADLSRRYEKNESTIRGWLKGGKNRAAPEEIKELAIKAATIETKVESFHPLDQKIFAAVKSDTMDMAKNIHSAGNDTALVSKMFAKAAKDATSQIMFKAMGDDGETISPERLAACTEEIAAVMKSTVVSNEASKISLKLMDIAAKQDKPETVEKEDQPVKFYIPDNGRK